MLLQRGPSISDLRMIVIWIGGQIWVEWALQDVTCTRGILQLAVLVVVVLVVVTPFLISLFFLSFFGSGPWIQSWSHLRTKPDTLKRKHENACNCLMAPSSSTPWDVPRFPVHLFELFITFAGEGAPLKCPRTSTAVEQTNRPEGYFASRGAGCETGVHYATMCLPLSFGLSPSLSFSLYQKYRKQC